MVTMVRLLLRPIARAFPTLNRTIPPAFMTATPSPDLSLSSACPPPEMRARAASGRLHGRLGRWLGAGALMLSTLLGATAAHAFDFETVSARARQLAGAPYKPAQQNLPRELAELSYERYKDIEYKPERFAWRNARLPFELSFFHEGMVFDQPVRINEVVGGSVREFRFDPTAFNYGPHKVDPAKLKGLGFAGFRLMYPVNQGSKGKKDELASFLGASYFRALGRDQWYGLSARGLAVDTGLNSGEEFPRFTEFWIERPGPNDKQLTLYALMDSRRLSGAYRFIIKPGTETVMEVKARLFLRENVTKLGLAPLTSMYLFGENQPSGTLDFRPEVHDSDGLSIHLGTGEWVWRPLVNPKRLLVTSFASTNPQGFGLMQRDRSFDNYQEIGSWYERRPSGWVEPRGNWGSGRIELVQIPTPDETNDNIVAYWIPDNPPKPKQAFDYEYRLLWQKETANLPPLSWVTQTRRGQGLTRKPDDTSFSLTVDFEGPAFKKLPEETKLEPVISADANGELLKTSVVRNEATGGWRMTMFLRRKDENKPVELRGYLRNGNTTLSETWSYILPPG
ncbi:glucan biosynthesis protein G [Cupriavidus plantarum]|uniref:Glucans biosynthesis protein G n=2 Tax=Cupriavidus plantarum TaxID=942865 RepID=A0A316ERI1_9BURK|nr:glucans biosynthesis protein [Cupriavidus plantarum]RLK38944.1 glucans biosynthesis protein [Cupriavidus plantarum]CAG2136328.1 Glucans biosynthesis protein G [Cupriavidus plantarum]SMR84726.1 glucans biosynthesis protein [Cupriavidus plantarum]